MKTVFSLFAAAFFTATSFAQVTSEVRPVGEFNGIRSVSMVKVQLTQGEACSVTVDADAEVAKNISTTVDGGVLVIKTSNMKGVDDNAVVKVTVKKLNTLDASSAAEISTTNQLAVDTLYITGAGASMMKLDVQASRIKANMTGAGSLKLSGTANTLDAHMAGASELKAYELKAQNVYVTTSGAASARVSASQMLEASSAGASDIHYEGEPAQKKINASGTSSVSRRDGSGKESDTTSVRIGDYDVHVTEHDGDDERSKREKKADDDDFKFWSGIDFGVTGYLASDNQLELPTGFEFLELNYAKSYIFGVNLFQKNIHIYRNNVNLGTGLGLTWYHYNFRNSYSLTPDVAFATATFDSLKYSKNRLNVCYANVPLFLEFNTNNNDASNSFHFAAGMQFGYNVFHNKLKQKYEDAGQEQKRKVEDDFNINPFRYDVIARIGYGKFTIFGTYSLSSLFERGKGPVVYPFSAGVNISI